MRRRGVRMCAIVTAVMLALHATGCAGSEETGREARSENLYGNETAQEAAETDALQALISQKSVQASVRTSDEDADKEETVYVVADGSAALYDGASQLHAGTKELSDGAGALFEGVSELSGGVNELTDGVGELLDGVIELDEEGIQKITKLLGRDLQEFRNRISAIRDAGNAYESFSGIREDMKGSVRVLIKTDGIAPEEES